MNLLLAIEKSMTSLQIRQLPTASRADGMVEDLDLMDVDDDTHDGLNSNLKMTATLATGAG